MCIEHVKANIFKEGLQGYDTMIGVSLLILISIVSLIIASSTYFILRKLSIDRCGREDGVLLVGGLLIIIILYIYLYEEEEIWSFMWFVFVPLLTIINSLIVILNPIDKRNLDSVEMVLSSVEGDV